MSEQTQTSGPTDSAAAFVAPIEGALQMAMIGQLNRIEQGVMALNERVDRLERRGLVANGGGLVTSLREALAKALAPPAPAPRGEGWSPTGACDPSAQGPF